MRLNRQFQFIDEKTGLEIQVDLDLDAPELAEREIAPPARELSPAERRIHAVFSLLWPTLLLALLALAWFSPLDESQPQGQRRWGMSIGTSWWYNHTAWSVPRRGIATVEAWKAGLWDARWFGVFDNGYGYPFHSYYAPLFTWMSAAFMKASGTVSAPIRFLLFLWLAFGTAGMAAAAGRFWRWTAGERAERWRPGLLAAMGWLMSPYLMLDVYSRGDLAEFAAIQIFPWIFWGGIGLLGRRGAWRGRDTAELLFHVLLLAAGILTHNFLGMVVCAIALAMIPLVFILRAFRADPAEAAEFSGMAVRVAAWCAGFALALLMTVFFWLPALKEMRYTALSTVKEGYFNYTGHFLYADNYLNPQGWGWGRSETGVGWTPNSGGSKDELGFHLGWFGFLSAASAVAGLAGMAILQRRRNDRLAAAIVFLIAIGAFGVFLTMEQSKLIWDKVGLLQFAQFPWRLLCIPTFALALLAPAALIGADPSPRGWALIGALALMAACFAMSFHSYVRIQFVLGDSPENDPKRWNGVRVITTDIDEYRPIWVPPGRPATWPAGSVLADPAIKVIDSKSDGINVRAAVENLSSKPHPVVIAVNYFPGWRAWIHPSGKPLKVLPDAATGFLSAQDVPAGKQEIRARFGDTRLRLRTKILSGIGWLAWLGGWGALARTGFRGRRGGAAAAE